MQIRLLEDQFSVDYENFLKQHECAMIYYSQKYKNFLKELLGAESLYLVAEGKDKKIEGILPLLVKTGQYGTVINSLPYYGSNGGILSTNLLAKKALLEEYISLIETRKYACSTIIDNPLDQNYDYDRIDVNERDSRIGQLTNISGQFDTMETLMVKFHYKTRNIIRKAIKSNIKVDVDNNLFSFLEEIHNDNMKSIGGMAKNSRFFNLVPKYFSEGVDYDIYVARHEGVPVSAMLVFYYGSIVEYYTPVIVREFRHLQPLSLLIATAMFNASSRGFKWWNWGGTWQSQDGVYDFKSKWGTQDIIYNYHTTIVDQELYNCTKEQLLEAYPGFYIMPFTSLNN